MTHFFPEDGRRNVSISLLLLGFARRQITFKSAWLDGAFTGGLGTDTDLQLAQGMDAGLAV